MVGSTNETTKIITNANSVIHHDNNYNIDKAVNALDNNALSSSSGYCAKYVRIAMEAGGLNTTGRPGSAKDYNNSFLDNLGFSKVSNDNYTPQKGDVVVMESFQGAKKNHPHGHIEMYDGKQWVSDFKQKDFWPGSDYRNKKPDYTIHRWE